MRHPYVAEVPEQPISPPLRKPVSEQHSPNHRDGFYLELLAREDSAFNGATTLKRGTPYDTWIGAKQEIIDRHAAVGGLFFVKSMSPFGGDVRSMPQDKLLILYWASD